MDKQWVLGLLLGIALPASAAAESSFLKFDGGIGVHPVTGNAPPFAVNVVRNIAPGGQPWVIKSLTADIKMDGRISVSGRGLLLAGGNGIGTAGTSQSVRATLLCANSGRHDTQLVPLDADGDFRIDGMLAPAGIVPCDNPVLLIVNAGDRWFAAGIPKR